MTASQKLPTRHSLFQNSQARLKKALTRFPLHIVIIGIGLLWMTPAFGLLTSSFRDSAAVASSGWWTAFQPPFEFTLENYQDVLTRNRDVAELY